MDCVECGGRDPECPHCRHGDIEITECPLVFVDYETQQFINYAELYLDHGLPPVGGGSLDQTVWFIRAAGFVSYEVGQIKRRLGIIDG